MNENDLDFCILNNLLRSIKIVDDIIYHNNFDEDEMLYEVEKLEDFLEEAYSAFREILDRKGIFLKDENTNYIGTLVKFPNEEAA